MNTLELLNEVKENLFITWNSEDDKIDRLINRGKDNLDSIMGVKLDYTLNKPKHLLINWCRYERNSASENFLTNFDNEILNLQLDEAVKLNNLPGDTIG